MWADDWVIRQQKRRKSLWQFVSFGECGIDEGRKDELCMRFGTTTPLFGSRCSRYSNFLLHNARLRLRTAEQQQPCSWGRTCSRMQALRTSRSKAMQNQNFCLQPQHKYAKTLREIVDQHLFFSNYSFYHLLRRFFLQILIGSLVKRENYRIFAKIKTQDTLWWSGYPTEVIVVRAMLFCRIFCLRNQSGDFSFVKGRRFCCSCLSAYLY